MDYKPWIEKYRPTQFKDIVLEKTNKTLLKNIIKQKNFPNLIFYGPPGTGKTTTIINLINEYHNKYYPNIKGLKIHLNASDDRGIDVIRNQINQFVNTKSLFGNGLKFVILDEVDYMTKNAQQALRYLIQQYSNDIRFCLICNYISKIDKALQNEFIQLCFCNLPQKDIYNFLNHIVKSESLNINKEQIQNIQKMFNSDIRSMINYIQTNHNNININHIITNDVLEQLINLFKSKHKKNICNEINSFIIKYCKNKYISIYKFIKFFIVYIIENKEYCLNKIWLTKLELIVHNEHINIDIYLSFFINHLYELYNSL
jgi:DNA polymerase III delta prime subunit